MDTLTNDLPLAATGKELRQCGLRTYLWAGLHNYTLSDPPPYLPGRFRSKSIAEVVKFRPPDGGEPGPNQKKFLADLAKWTVGKRTRVQQRADRRRLARTARKELTEADYGQT